MAKQKEHKVEIRNRRASFDYEFLETYIAGISLVSTEIKSIRMGKASLVDSFCYFVGNELFVKGMNVAQYFWGSWGQHEPMRDRKLLLTSVSSVTYVRPSRKKASPSSPPNSSSMTTASPSSSSP